MKRMLVRIVMVPLIGWLVTKVVQKISITREQHAAREKVAPAA